MQLTWFRSRPDRDAAVRASVRMMMEVMKRVSILYKNRSGYQDGARGDRRHIWTWRCSADSCCPPSASSCCSPAVRPRRGTNRWPAPATTLWVERPGCCPAFGGLRTRREPSRSRLTASLRPTARLKQVCRTSSWGPWSVLQKNYGVALITITSRSILTNSNLHQTIPLMCR